MRGYFEGWYLKQQSDREVIALIPALHIRPDGRKSASIQVITPQEAYCASYPGDAFALDRREGRMRVGESRFTSEGLRLDIRTEAVIARGEIAFGPLSPLQYDIMGPFRFVPFLECRHSVMSMVHTVRGSLTVNGRAYDFAKDMGYWEGDRGSSFPRKYVWAQCSWRQEGLCSLFLSVAEIPLMGLSFTGIIGAVLLGGREYRMATYLGARIMRLEAGAVTVAQNGYLLSAELVSQAGRLLRAPVKGEMTRLIREDIACRARFRFSYKSDVLFDFETDQAGFESEYGN